MFDMDAVATDVFGKKKWINFQKNILNLIKCASIIEYMHAAAVGVVGSGTRGAGRATVGSVGYTNKRIGQWTMVWLREVLINLIK